MDLFEPVLPIFLVIALGYVMRRAGFLKECTLGEVNKFVFNFSLPALIFTGITKSNFEGIKPQIIVPILVPTILTLFLSFFLGVALKLKGGRLGTFLQTSIHGNVSYIGLAVLFYSFGENSLKVGSLFVGLLIFINNAFAIAALRLSGNRREFGFLKTLLSILRTPVIIATFAGIFFAICRIVLPSSISRTLTIVSNVALPMALVVIGGSMKGDYLSLNLPIALLISLLKLILLPSFSFLLVKYLRLPPTLSDPLVLLFASPVAISSFVMARELDGDPKLASSAITLSTILFPISFVFWKFLMEGE